MTARTKDDSLSQRDVILRPESFEALFHSLCQKGYQLIGPILRDGAIVYDHFESRADLPAGWADEHEAGHYRLRRRDDQALFGFSVGPHSWKNFLHPPEVRLWSAQRRNGTFRILNNEPVKEKPYALIGVRACEVAAIATQDRVLLRDKYTDVIYEKCREKLFVVAVQCTQSAATCFCASMGTGPQMHGGFDLLLTELTSKGNHRFVVKAGTSVGAEVLAELKTEPASDQDIHETEVAVENAAREQVRGIDKSGIREVLYWNFDHPHWDEIAQRCLTCGNCTMVCPTCFCTTLEDTSDVTGEYAERRRRWDSCFSLNFSYIHGGSVRASSKARYRQWMTHKLASWIDQFGTSGCVGCGRCITWCPAGIDITKEARIFQEAGHGNT